MSPINPAVSLGALPVFAINLILTQIHDRTRQTSPAGPRFVGDLMGLIGRRVYLGR